MSNGNVLQGAVKKVMPKGFGFITGDNGQDYFFHASAVSVVDGQSRQSDKGRNPLFDLLTEGDRVSFEVEVDGGQDSQGRERGPRAVWVER